MFIAPWVIIPITPSCSTCLTVFTNESHEFLNDDLSVLPSAYISRQLWLLTTCRSCFLMDEYWSWIKFLKWIYVCRMRFIFMLPRIDCQSFLFSCFSGEWIIVQVKCSYIYTCHDIISIIIYWPFVSSFSLAVKPFPSFLWDSARENLLRSSWILEELTSELSYLLSR